MLNDTDDSKFSKAWNTSPHVIYKCWLFQIEQWGDLRPAYKIYPGGKYYKPVLWGFWIRVPKRFARDYRQL